MLLLLFLGQNGYSQTLYVPGGTGGIGSSSNGNVGIGVGSPLSKLDVNGDILIRNASIPMGLMTELSGTFTPILNFDLNFREPNKNNSYRGGALRMDSRDGLPFFQWLGRSAGSTVENTLMSLTEDGKLGVGIGTTSPLSKLHINSSIERETFRIYKQGNTANYLSLWQGTGGGVIDPIGTGLLHLGYDQSTNVIMGYTGAGVNSGNVGIGTPNPDAKLAVKGQIHAQEVKVDLNGAVAPDYVFASNYQLPTLDYIKTYIDQYKHLPEVPSAKEMETNGVNLGEMNMLLLKKIEELTLHLISQEKRIKELEKNNK